MKLKYTILVLSSLAFVACKPKLEAGTPDKGNVDATRYVAIGGSLTAGIADGALYREGQENSFPNIIAGQFELIGGGEFRMPWLSENSVGIGPTLKSKSVLGYRTDCTGATSLGPVAFDANGGDVAAFGTNIYASGSPFHNMGVPGATAAQLLFPGYGNAAEGAGNYNPYFYRMAASPVTSSVLGDAVIANPTFFTVNVGEQDALNYAMSGATASAMMPANGAPGAGFNGTLTHIVTSLNANGARGAISNVPDVTLYPYFNTVPWNGLTLDAANAATLSGIYVQLGFSFKEGSNAFVIADADAPAGRRQIKAGELICLGIPLDSVKCHKMGTIVPIPDRYVLTLEELAEIRANINAYNTAISNVANTYGLALADVNSFLRTVKTGFVFNGIGLNANFVSGGAFSLDGIHLNPIGNALIANVYIKAINSSFGSTIPQVDATKYRGVKFP